MRLFAHILNRAASAAALSRVKPSVNRVLALKPQTAFANRRTVVLKLCTDLVPVTNTNIDTKYEKGWSSDRPFFFCGFDLRLNDTPIRSVGGHPMYASIFWFDRIASSSNNFNI